MDIIFYKIVDPCRAATVIGITIALVVFTAFSASSILFFVMIGIGTLILAFFRIIFTYVTAMMMLTFIMMFAPLFLTLLLFPNPSTKNMFNGWLASIINYALQPVLVLAFLFVIGQVLSMETLVSGIVCGGNTDCMAKNAEEIIQKPGDIIQKPSDIIQKPGDDDYKPESHSFLGIENFEFPAFPKLDLGILNIIWGRIWNPLVMIINILGFVLAWIILNMVAVGFIDKIPELAGNLARFGSVRSTPIGGGAGQLNTSGDQFQPAGGIYKPEDSIIQMTESGKNIARRGIREVDDFLEGGNKRVRKLAESDFVKKNKGLTESLVGKVDKETKKRITPATELLRKKKDEEKEAIRRAQGQATDDKVKREAEAKANDLNTATALMDAKNYDEALRICYRYVEDADFASLLQEINRRKG